MLAPLSAVGISRYHRPQRDFEPVRRDFLRDAYDHHRDRPLSLRAFRVASFILAHAEGFAQTQEQIARRCGLSVTTVRAALEDLRKAGYLASRRVREGGRWLGTAYAVSDIPFTEEELASLCPPGAESEGTESERSESVRPKKTTPARETTSEQREQLSEGTADAVAAAPQEEAPEMPRPKAPEQPGLFEVVQIEGRQNGKSATQTIVSAFVDSHRQHHGADPTRSEIGRVARDVKRMIGNPHTVEHLLAAATAMGATPFANISMQLKKTSVPSKGMAQAHPHGAEEWQQGSQVVQNEAAAALNSNPELAAWLAGQAVSA